MLSLILIFVGIACPALAAGWVEGTAYERQGDRRAPLAKVRIRAKLASGGEVLATARTDSEGRFQLGEMPAARITFEASKYGYLTRVAGGQDGEMIALDCSVPNACRQIDFELVRGGVIVGQVVDQLGEPLEDVNLYLTRGDAGEPIHAGSWTRGRGRSDDRGLFRIPGLETGRYTVRSAGGGSFRGKLNLAPDPVTVDVEEGIESEGVLVVVRSFARPSFRVAGTVTGVDLTAEADHSVGIWTLHQPGTRRRRFGRTARLDAEGQFAFSGLPEGRYRLQYSRRSASDPERPETRLLGTIDVSGDVSGLVLQPLPPTGFSGFVRFESDGPPGGVVLAFASEDAMGTRWVAAEPPDYRFKSTDLPPGSYEIRARTRGFFLLGIRRGDQVVPARNIRLVAGQMEELEIVLSKEFGQVYGRIKAARETERPTKVREGAHFLVALASAGTRKRWVRADQHGRFLFKNVVPGDYRICAWPNLSPDLVRDEAVWQKAGKAVRSFPVEANTEIEIELTAVTVD